jgi:predicted RNase H-like HicB family nuclease
MAQYSELGLRALIQTGYYTQIKEQKLYCDLRGELYRMANKKKFLVSIVQEGKFFVARCPELGVTSQGESLVEAQKNLKEAIELYIESFGLEELPDMSVAPYWTTVEVEA